MYVLLPEVEIWFYTTFDGLKNLRSAITSGNSNQINKLDLWRITTDEAAFLTPGKWAEFIQAREAEHEMFGSLAALAAFEGIIRRDAEWRGTPSQKQPLHFEKFRKIYDEERTRSHPKITELIDVWRSEHQAYPLKKHLTIVKELFRDRNELAHGQAVRNQYVFQFIYDRLEMALAAWRHEVNGFGIQ